MQIRDQNRPVFKQNRALDILKLILNIEEKRYMANVYRGKHDLYITIREDPEYEKIYETY
jgi:hypothetical protein